ncbi:MAG: hypothetical protein ACXWLJ_11125 [Rhizomicrobium sp.]
MRKFHTALALSSVLAIAGGLAPMTVRAQTVDRTYVACNAAGDCWRVHHIYAYGESTPIRYYNGDWYEAHHADANIHWVADPTDDRGYYVEGRWHPDPAAHVVASGATGAGLGAAIGCLVTLPIGCAPGAAVGAAVGGGTGVVAGAATAPHE